MDDYGEETFYWPSLHSVRHKPLDADLVDNYDKNFLFDHGAHMTLMVFLQDGGGRRRSESAYKRRAVRRQERANEKKRTKTGSKKSMHLPRRLSHAHPR